MGGDVPGDQQVLRERRRDPAHHVRTLVYEPLIDCLPGTPAGAAGVVGLLDGAGTAGHRMRRVGDVLVEWCLTWRWRIEGEGSAGAEVEALRPSPLRRPALEGAPALGPG